MIIGNFEDTMWHDSSLEKIVIEYNDIIAELETDNVIRRIIFKNYIAIDYIGQWDENIVESIYEEKNEDIIKKALEKVNNSNHTKRKGGGTRDINATWICLIIRLIDGVCIRIVCDGIVVESC